MRPLLFQLSLVILLFSLHSCTESITSLEEHSDDCSCGLHNIEQEDLEHRDALSLSLDTLNDVTPYNFHETFSIHGTHSTETSTIDLLSWGNVNMPDLIILLSNDKDFKRSHIVRLSGKLAQHWIKDLNRDGNPELVLFSIGSGSGSYGDLKIVEFDAGLGMKVYKLKNIEAKDHKGYFGHDNFIIHGDTIKRTFPKFLDDDPNCCPTGGYEAIDYLWEIEDYFELIDQR